MSNASSGQILPEKNFSRAKRFRMKPLRLLLKIFGGLLLVIVLLLAGLLIWLRTSQAEAFIQRLVTEQLAAQGIVLRLDEFSGPLPGRLQLGGLELADAHGPWLRAKEAEVEIDLPGLLGLELAVKTLRVDSPELIRLPEGGPSEAEADEPAEDVPDGPFMLPFSVRFEQLSLNNGKLGQAVLDAAMQEDASDSAVSEITTENSVQVTVTNNSANPAAATPLPNMALSLRGHGALSRSGLNLNLDAALLHTDGSGLVLRVYTGPTNLAPANLDLLTNGEPTTTGGETVYWPLEISGQDTLKILLSARETSGGLLANILEEPDLPAYELLLEGSGPPQNWLAELNLAIGERNAQATQIPPLRAADTPLIDPQNRLLSLQGTLGFKASDSGINFDELFSSRLQAWLDFSLTPGNSLPPPFDELHSLSSLASPTLALRAHGKLEDRIFQLEAANLETPVWSVRAEDLELNNKLLGGSRLSGKLTAAIKDWPGFMLALSNQNPANQNTLSQNTANQDAANTVTLQSATFSSDLQADFSDNQDSENIYLQADGRLEARLAQDAGQNLGFDYSLSAGLNGQAVSLDTFKLAGHGMELTADGNLDLEQGSLSAAAALLAQAGGNAADEASNSPVANWRLLLQALAASVAENIPQGKLALNLELESNELLPGVQNDIANTAETSANYATSVSVKLTGDELFWNIPQLNSLLSRQLILEAELNGSGANGYTLKIDELEAGLAQVTGQAKLRNAGPPGRWGETLLDSATLEAEFKARLSSLAPLLDNSGFSQAEPVPDSIAISQTELAPEATPATGAELSLHASGAINALTLESLLQVADLHSPSGVLLSGIQAEITAQNNNFSSLHGLANFALTQENSGDLRFGSDWELALPGPRQDLIISLRNLALNAAGLALSADIQASLAEAQPRLQGQGQLDITDWKMLAAFTGVRFAGEAASAGFKLSPQPEGQELDLFYKMGRFGITEGDSSGHGVKNRLFNLSSLEFDLNAANIFHTPQINFTANAGSGRIGVLNWRSATAQITSGREQGNFNLALFGRSQADSPNQSQTARQDQKPAAADNKQTQGSAKSADFIGNERLALAGSFNLSTMQVLLEHFNLRSADSATSLNLLAPAQFMLGQGLQLPELKLAATPSGTIAASAKLDANGEQVKLNIGNLDFSVASLFTDAQLPIGSLSLNADLNRQNDKLDGQLNLQARLVPEEDIQVVDATEYDAELESAKETAPENLTDSEAGKSAAELTAAGLLPADQLAAGLPPADQLAAGLLPADQLAGQAFTVYLNAKISPNPLPVFPALRKRDGFTRLQGQGGISYAGAPEDFKEARLDFDLPLRLNPSALPGMDFDAPLGASLDWQGPTGPFWRIIPMADRELTGFGKVDLKLGGSLNQPRYAGNAYLVSGRYEDRVLGLLLDAINMEASGNNSSLEIRLAASDGGSGTLTLEGAILPPERSSSVAANSLSASSVANSASPQPKLAVRGQINHLRPLHRDDLSIQLSGIFGLNGPLGAPAITGTLELERGEYNLRGLGGGVRTLEITDPLAASEELQVGPGPTLDVTVSIPSRFYVRGMGIESEWAGLLHAFGPAAQPELVGSISPVRGYFELLTKPFAFSGGGVQFMGGKKINPSLDLQLTHTGPNITALVNVYGTANRPQLKLSSEPPRPQDQVLAEVLFGKEFSALSRFEAIQVANSLHQLSGGESFDLMGSMRQTLGVDMLRISGGESTAQQQRNTYGTLGAAELGAGSGSGDNGDDESMPRLEAGKYINDAIYIGFEQGVTENSTGARVEVELRPNLTLQGRSNVQSSEVGIGWKKDY